MTLPSSLSFLDTIAGYSQTVAKNDSPSANAPILIAVIDPNYVAYTYPGTLPKVTFEGESTMSEKRYPVIGDYLPLPSARVVMIPVGHTHVIVGPLNTPPQLLSASAGVAAEVSTSTVDPTYVALTGGPSVEVALRVGQKVRVSFQCELHILAAGTNGARCAIRVTGASGTREPVDAEGAENGEIEWAPAHKQFHYTASTAGNHTFELRYQAINTSTAHFKNRWVFVESL